MKTDLRIFQTIFYITLCLIVIALLTLSCEKAPEMADYECVNTITQGCDSVQFVTIYRARTGEEIGSIARSQIFVQAKIYNGTIVYLESNTVCHQIKCE